MASFQATIMSALVMAVGVVIGMAIYFAFVDPVVMKMGASG